MAEVFNGNAAMKKKDPWSPDGHEVQRAISAEEIPSPWGFLLIGHGTRDQQGLAEFAETVRQAADQLAPLPVEAAFLELAIPTIAEGFQRLVQRGVRQIVTAPLLLFAAGHAKQDIPQAVAAAASKHPGIPWRQAEHLGCHPTLLELSAARFRNALGAEGAEGIAAGQCKLVVVGRGSRDPEALAETRRYAHLVSDQVGVLEVQVGFLAMAQPRLADVLSEVAVAAAPIVIVQPHLLFHGELLQAVQAQVEEWRRQVPRKQWLIAEHLGAASQVVTAVVDRCRQAML